MITAMALVVGVVAGGAALSETDVVALALKNSPQLKAQEHVVLETKALTEASLAWNNPKLRFSSLRYDELIDPLVDQRTYGNHPLYHASVALRWSPPGLGERSARRAEGTAKEADAQMEQAIARRDVVALVRRLHAQILSFDAQISLGRDVAEQRDKLRSLVKRRLEQQMATLLEENLVEVDYLDARTELASLEMHRRAAYDELLLQLGLPAGAAVELAGSPQDCTAPEAAATLAERARATNPRLQWIEAQERAAEAELSRRRLELIPWLDYFQVGYGFAGDTRPGYIALQLQLTLPVFDWKGPHRRALAERYESLADRVHVEDRKLSDQVLRLVATQAEQAALVERYRQAASVVEGGLGHLRDAVEKGRITNLFELVQLQTRLLAAKRSYLRANLECKLQKIELDRITNQPFSN